MSYPITPRRGNDVASRAPLGDLSFQSKSAGGGGTVPQETWDHIFKLTRTQSVDSVSAQMDVDFKDIVSYLGRLGADHWRNCVACRAPFRTRNVGQGQRCTPCASGESRDPGDRATTFQRHWTSEKLTCQMLFTQTSGDHNSLPPEWYADV